MGEMTDQEFLDFRNSLDIIKRTTNVGAMLIPKDYFERLKSKIKACYGDDVTGEEYMGITFISI